MNAALFYHLYIPPDWRAVHWSWWVDQQLGTMHRAGLHNAAQVCMCITMPAWWTELMGIPIRPNSAPTDWPGTMTFEAKVREYIQARYPWVTVWSVRDTSDTNIYEAHTLTHVWRWAQSNSGVVGYVHSKGVVSASASVCNWREVLDYYMLTRWRDCVAALTHQHRVVGVSDANSRGLVTSGNFWWATTQHCASLSDPLRSDLYVPDIVEFQPHAAAWRYAFERWILSDQPPVHWIAHTGVDHFREYCFLENLVSAPLVVNT
jgi:hypothetical protein